MVHLNIIGSDCNPSGLELVANIVHKCLLGAVISIIL